MRTLRKQKKRFSLKEHKSQDDSKELGQMMSNSVRDVIKKEQRQGGF